MSALTPMEQLRHFCQERRNNPPPGGEKHIAEWAAEEIERLTAKNRDLRARERASRRGLKFLGGDETWKSIDGQLSAVVDLFQQKATLARDAAKRHRARGDLVRWRKACAVARVWEMARDRVAQIGFFPF